MRRSAREILPTALLVPTANGGPRAAPDWSESDARTRRELLALLAQHQGNVTEVAKAMGKARMQVQRWIKKFDIDASTFRRAD